MKVIKETCIAGKVIDVTLKVSSGKHNEKRKEKRNVTPEKIQKNNDRIAQKQLMRLLNANFQEGDLHIVLTYKTIPTIEQAKKDRGAFIRKIRKSNPGVKYITVTEYEHTRIHHHIVLSKMDIGIITEAWKKKGYVHQTSLDDTGEYQKLAEYLIKETSKTFREPGSVNKRRYACSNNLFRPIVKREEVSMKEMFEEPEPIKGYYIPKDSIRRYPHPVTGIEHIEYLMVAIDKPRKNKVWNRGKRVSAREYFRVNHVEEQEGWNI